MKNNRKHFLCVLLSAVLLFSALVLPAVTVDAAAEFEHPLSGNATSAEKTYVQELKSADPDCIYSYTTIDFTLPYKSLFGDQVVSDSDAYTGKAAEIRADTRKAKEPGAEGHLNVFSRELPFCTVNIDQEAIGVGSIPGSMLIVDGKYHLYKLDDVVVVRDEPLRFLYIFNDWGFQIPSLPADIAHEPNAKVDLYLSMKIVGDKSFTDVNNLPAYYIDRVIVVGPEREYVPEITINTEPVEMPNATNPAENPGGSSSGGNQSGASSGGNQGGSSSGGNAGNSEIIVGQKPNGNTGAVGNSEIIVGTNSNGNTGGQGNTGVILPDPTIAADPTETTNTGTEETTEATVDSTTEMTEDTVCNQTDTDETTENTGTEEATNAVTGEEEPIENQVSPKNRTALTLGIIAAVVLVGAGLAVFFLMRLDKKKIAMIVSISAGTVLVILLIVLMISTANHKKNFPVDTTASTARTDPSGSDVTADTTDADTNETSEGTVQTDTTEGTEEPAPNTTDVTEPSATGPGPAAGTHEGAVDTNQTNPTIPQGFETTPTTPPTPTVTEPVVVNGKLSLTGMTLVLPKFPTTVEMNAANELVSYVKKITGKTIQTVNEGASVNAGIYIGATNFARTNNVSYPTTEYGEGWAIKVIGNNLVLCGEATRGTLYAVYHLLEDVLGVRWWTYAEEHVPSVENALVPQNYADNGAPAFKYRDMHPGALHKTTNMFQVRNRLNGWDANPPAGYGGEENFGSPVYVHSFAYYVPDTMFATHPEWFSLVNGQRAESSQLCMTNTELIAYMKERLLYYIDLDISLAKQNGTATPRWYSLCPNDYDKFCECASCTAVINQSGMSGYLLRFVNQIAAAVETKYPEILVDTLAYWQYLEPPKDNTKPAKNVQIRFADNIMDVLHSFDHPNNEKALRYLKQWAAITENGQLFVWDYVVNYGVNGITPTMYKFPEHFQTLLQAGVTGYFGEQEDPINTDFWDMKMWLSAKLLEDPYQDFNALMNDFLNGYYGAAGPYVRRYLDLVGGLLKNSSTYVQFGQSSLSPRWLTYDAVIAADAYFDMAFQAANGNETILRRLRLARNCLDRVIVERFETYQADAAATGKAFNFNKKELCQNIIACLNEQIAMRGDADYVAKSSVLPYYQNILAGLG